MTMLQEQAVRMIQDMSDDNVGFFTRSDSTINTKENIYQCYLSVSEIRCKKMQAFKELVATRYEAKKIFAG